MNERIEASGRDNEAPDDIILPNFPLRPLSPLTVLVFFFSTSRMSILLSGIISAKVSSVAGVQTSYLPFHCELSHESGKIVLSLTNDDGSGDLERRVFIMSEARIDMKQKGSVPAISVATRSGAIIKLQFSNKEAQSRWFIALNKPAPVPSKDQWSY